jgi:hypothetical protein
MAYRTTLGWSLVSSGIVTLLLFVLPGPSLYWGLAFILAGSLILYYRDDRGF